MSKSHSDTKRFPLAARLGTSASLLTLIAMGAISPVHAQEEEDESVIEEEVVVRGMRSSIQSAQELKKASNKIQDSIVAEDIGKLPDRSIAEALQRISGVTVSRFDQPGDPEHFAGEGAGVSVRGLPQVRAELNGRDIFSAADGRALSFDDVPAELMAGVDVFKSPTADMIEGGLGGIVNLRTRMPFDQDGQLLSATVKANYGDVISETNFEGSVLYSNVWDTNIGKLGFLVDFSNSEISSRADNLYNRAYFPRNDIDDYDETVYVPKGADWRRNDYTRVRNGKYLALQLEPTDSLEFYLTAFESRAQRDWYENAFFIDAGTQPTPVSGANDWVLDANNVFLEGTITSGQGVSLGTSSRLSANDSKTADYSFGFEWNDGPWTVNADIQRVISEANRIDNTLGTVVFPQRVFIGNVLSDSGPTIIDLDEALADPDSYSFGQMMHRPADNDAQSNAVRLDVQYDFDDSVIQSVKAGVRYSKKEAANREFTNWTARVQPWNLGAWSEGVPTIGGSRLMQPYSFDDFQRGDADVPTEAWMFTTDAVDNFRETTDAMVAATIPPAGSEWAVSQPSFDTPATNLNSDQNKSLQEETSYAGYVMMDLAFTEQLGGNIGVRYVTTENTADGYLLYEDREFDSQQPWYSDPVNLISENDYSHVLPSLNLRYDATEDLVFRFSAAKGIWKPEFWRLKNYWEFIVENPEGVSNEDLVGVPIDEIDWRYRLSSGGTNPLLEPMTAIQYDLTAEWYFNDNGGMVYTGVFLKDVEDFFRTGNFTVDALGETWEGDSYVNVGTADVSGFEIGGTYYFDTLPEPFDNFGISANYTYIDSSTDIPVYESDGNTTFRSDPVDTDGSAIEVNELEGLAENTYNITLMYETETFYARLAYNHSSESLQSIGPNGWNGTEGDIAWRLPIYADAYGQLDFSAGYNFNDNVSLNFEAYNISQSETKGLMRQNIAGDHLAFVYSQDTRYGLSLRLTY